MAFVVPWQNAAEFQFEIALDNVVFLLHTQWNWIANSWALDIYTRADIPVCLGIRLVHGTTLIAGSRTNRPAGQFVLQGGEPSYDGMINGGCRLVYLTGEEMRAL